MKKVIYAFMTLAIVLNLCVLFPVSIAAEATLDGNLVVHYDFEGTTVEEALKDKATAGTVADDLRAYTANTKNTDPKGVLVAPVPVDSEDFRQNFKIDTEKGTASTLQAGAVLEALSSEDVRKIYAGDKQNPGTATWFLRFKIADIAAASEARLVDMRVNASSGNMFSILMNPEGKLLTNAARTASKKNNYWYSTDTLGKISNNEYVNFVLVMEKGTGTSGYETDVKYTPYLSYGNPTSAEDWIALTATSFVSFRTDRLGDAPLALFDRYDSAGANNPTVTYDDVRLYDKGLTVEEMQKIFEDGSFDTVRLVGSQTKKSVNGEKYSVRFVATSDFLDPSKVGFEVSATYRNGGAPVVSGVKNFETKTVYSKLLAAGETVTAAELGGTYVYALVIDGIPMAYEEVSFEIRPYLIYGNTRIYGKTEIISYTQAMMQQEG